MNNFDIARIFMMYPNASVVDTKLTFYDVTYINLMAEWFSLSVYGREIRTEFWRNRKLVLTELRNITEEKILEICKMYSAEAFGDYRYSKWRVEYDEQNNGTTWFAATIKNGKSQHELWIDLIDGEIDVYYTDDKSTAVVTKERAYYQWYFLNNYAVPIYPFGKNAIELDVAITNKNL